jgi:alkyl hydroperoxide reductase subunit F
VLDPALVEKLKSLLESLESDYTLSLRPSGHARQAELEELARSLAGVSPRLTVSVEGPPIEGVALSLNKDGASTGVAFEGVPGGNEFSSLVLALLNADGKGKLPDEDIRRRVQQLKGPLSLRTFVMLNCASCPDVVQSLNQLALLNPGLQHTMVDGDMAMEEAVRRGVLAVPSVFLGDKLVHVGRADLQRLVQALEQHAGTENSNGPGGGSAGPG